MSKQQWIAENLKPGELYAGILLGINGEPDQHVILLPDETKAITWAAACSWASALGASLPTRREQRILFANLKAAFKPEWHWSSETDESDPSSAWIQYFIFGYQNGYRKSNVLRARAVRRLEI